ncbi:putative disease resistance protein [Labeo rohita]|uniref:Disease resistance protein n=1 Tax=Labeo rohita TaxID=84645 RepID=A0ABQ8M007_LABRO|nr:putative disease resistance protein [Labeo rohita]
MNYDLTAGFRYLQWCSHTVCEFPVYLFTEMRRNLKLMQYPLFFLPQNMIKLQYNTTLLLHEIESAVANLSAWFSLCFSFCCLVTVSSVWLKYLSCS